MKMNTILAVSGIVATSCVSMLPLAAYGTVTCTNNGRQCADNVDVDITVNPVIAMRIKSNADVTYGFIGYGPDGSEPSPDDSTSGNSQATGLSLAANQVDLTTLKSEIDVRSNTGAFTLTLKDADDNTNLNLATPSNTVGEYIPTASGTPVANTASWAVRGGDITNWTAMPASSGSALVIINNGANDVSPAAAYSDVTTVNYGVASGSIKTGTYSDIVVYTATTK